MKHGRRCCGQSIVSWTDLQTTLSRRSLWWTTLAIWVGASNRYLPKCHRRNYYLDITNNCVTIEYLKYFNCYVLTMEIRYINNGDLLNTICLVCILGFHYLQYIAMFFSLSRTPRRSSARVRHKQFPIES